MRRKTWVELPSSKYDIEYVLGSSIVASSPNEDLPLNPRKAIKRCLQKTTNILRRRRSNLSAFEQKIMELDQVTRRDGYGDGTAVMYIREIFEPGDAEYDYIGSYVCASKLSHEQVDRLRIMILPARREETLLSYLDYYKNAYQQHHIFNESTDVVRHFEGFHRRYSKLGAEDGGEKFDLLFSFTFAIKIYCGWILKFESTKRRATMIAALAKLWRKLFGRYTPTELGLDLEFSYPAALAFLEKFKLMCASIETFGYPTIEFPYQSGEMGVEVSISGNISSNLTRLSSHEHSIETRLIK